MRYELLDHTADLFVKAYGSSVEQCFENAAYAMFDQIADLSTVEIVEVVEVAAEGEDEEGLLYDFLSELLYVHDTEGLLLKEFEVDIEDGSLKCRARGEQLARDKHPLKIEIKAVTFHMMEINEDELYITVLFDI